ncbi:glutamic acid-rich protein-like [Macrobrachium rosenbergii]|uniref:glutamic acid-rich protein-like n=1 Tax=Macrobrachium rosenbergii TaxID=79674 RepID=UPI0034D70D2A
MAILSIANLFNLPTEGEHVEEECIKEKKGKSLRNRRRKRQQTREEYPEEENVIVLEVNDESGAAVEDSSCGRHPEEEDKLAPVEEDDKEVLLAEVEDVEEESVKEEKKGKSQRNRRRRKKQQTQEECPEEENENVIVLEAGDENEIEGTPVESGAAVEDSSCGRHPEEEDKLAPVEEDDKEVFELCDVNPFSLLAEVEDAEEECPKEEEKGKLRRNRRRRKRQERQEENLEEENVTVLEAGADNELEFQPETEIVPVKSRPELGAEEFEETEGGNEKSIIEDSVGTEDNKELDEDSKKLGEHSEILDDGSEEETYAEEPDDVKQSEEVGETRGGESEEDKDESGDEEGDEGESEEEEESDDDEESRDYRPKARAQDQPFQWRVPGLPRKRIPGQQKQRPPNPQPKKCRKKTQGAEEPDETDSGTIPADSHEESVPERKKVLLKARLSQQELTTAPSLGDQTDGLPQ